MPYGQAATLGIGFQSSGGTAVSNTSSFFHHPFLSNDFGVERPELISQNMVARFYEGDAYQGPSNAGGEAQMEIQPQAIGPWLKAIFGAPTTVQSGSFYTHTFKPRTTDWNDSFPNYPTSIISDLKEGQGASVLYDLCGSLMELTWTQGQFLVARFAFVGGGNVNSIGTVSPTADTSRRFTWDVCSISIASSGYRDLPNLVVTHDERLEPRYHIGNRAIDYITRAQPRQTNISGAIRYRDKGELTAYLNEEVRRLVVTCKTSTDVSSGYKEEFRVTIPSFKLTDFKPAVDGPGAIERPFTAKGQYNVGSDTSIEIVLVNNVASF